MRYKGSFKSDEINKSYERVIVKVAELTKDVEAYKTSSNATNTASSINANSAISFINSMKKDNIICPTDMRSDSMYNHNDTFTNIPITATILAGKDKNDASDLFIDVYDDDDYKVEESNKRDMFNGTYVRKVATPLTTECIYTTIIISIPQSVNPKTTSNFLSFKTFPYYNCSVKNIEYSPVYDNTYITDIETIKNHKGCVNNKYFLGEAGHGDITLSYPRRDTKKIIITIKSKECTVNGKNKIFYVGIQDLSIEDRVVKRNDSRITFTYNGNNIEKIIPVFSGNTYDCEIIPYKQTRKGLVKIKEEATNISNSNEVIFIATIPPTSDIVCIKNFTVIEK